MPSLKDYRDKIASVKSTRKITSAMKMVAASKLKRAQDHAERSQPYATKMSNMLSRLVDATTVTSASPVLLAGTGDDQTHLLVVITSDRGLCGGFNSYIIREAISHIEALELEKKEIKVICVGRKGYMGIKRQYSKYIIENFEGPAKKGFGFQDAAEVSDCVLSLLEDQKFDVCKLMYNEFKSVIAQVPTNQQLVPFTGIIDQDNQAEEVDTKEEIQAIYGFEPDEQAILEDLLPKNLAVQVFRAMLDSSAGEQAARMTAMDNATRNAGEMIDDLTLVYNRVRQAYITKELIEIISGAEAM